MKSISVAELSKGALFTQDVKPVAALMEAPPCSHKKAFSLAEHREWQRSVFGDGSPEAWVDESLARDREEKSSPKGLCP